MPTWYSRSASTSCTSRSRCLARGTNVESGNCWIMVRYSCSAWVAFLGSRSGFFHLHVVDVGDLHLGFGSFRLVGEEGDEVLVFRFGPGSERQSAAFFEPRVTDRQLGAHLGIPIPDTCSAGSADPTGPTSNLPFFMAVIALSKSSLSGCFEALPARGLLGDGLVSGLDLKMPN